MSDSVKEHLVSAARVFLSTFIVTAATAGAVSTTADVRALLISCSVAATSALFKMLIEWIFPDPMVK